MRICKEKDCKNKHLARGWCNKHYRRWRTHGDPLFTKREMHGYTNHHLYRVWHHMKQRCYNEKNTAYKYYGGRRITVCDEWKNSFETFIEWALPLWKKGLLIDRKNNEGNYEPSNCHFVTLAESNLNKGLLRKDSTSGFRGVDYRKDLKKWRARITINNKEKHLGLFNSKEEAALAFNNAVIDNRPKNVLNA